MNYMYLKVVNNCFSGINYVYHIKTQYTDQNDNAAFSYIVLQKKKNSNKFFDILLYYYLFY